MKKIILGMLIITCFGWQAKAQIPVYGINNANLEIVSFDSATPGTLSVLGPSSVTNTNDFENAGSVDPNNTGTAYVLSSLGDLFSVDLATGAYTLLGNIPPPGQETWTGMEFDPTDGTLYAISAFSDGVTSSTTLLSIDISSLSATNIGATGMGLGISLAIDGSGNIYALDLVDDNLYSINKTTGSGTAIGAIGFDANYGQGMCWDPNTDTIYMATINQMSATAIEEEWRSVDTTTGTTTLIGNLGPSGVVTQLGWVSIPDVPYCPAPDALAVTNISSTTAEFSWGNVSSATNGYEWAVYASGADPNTATPIDMGTTPSGTTSATATGLTAITIYDFYVSADCDVEGLSVLVGPQTFQTTPENDDLANAIMLTVNATCSGDMYTNLGATTQTDEPIGSCYIENTIEHTLWFAFVAPSSGDVNISTDIAPGAIGDTQLAVFEAPTDPNDLSTLGTEMGCGEDMSSTNYLTSLDLVLTPGQTYYIQVDGFDGATGSFCIEVADNLSIAETKFSNFSYHPNPVSKQLSLKANDNIEQVMIYNLLGQEVINIKPNELSSVMDVSKLNTGAYLMKVVIDGSEAVFRIIKE